MAALVERFIKFGQNTPLTCVMMMGFEHQNTARDGLASGTQTTSYLTSDPHRVDGNGGAVALQIGPGSPLGVAISPTFVALKEAVVVFAGHRNEAGTGALIGFDFCNGTTTQDRLTFSVADGGELRFLRSTSSELDQSDGVGLGDEWVWFHTWLRIGDADGLAEVRLNNWADLYLQVSAVDTKAHATLSTIDNVRPRSPSSTLHDPRYDDVMVFARSLYCTVGDVGLPSVGATVTGGTSGATAIVTAAYINADQALLLVHTVSGTFQDGEAVTDGALFDDAVANHALGNDEASLWIGRTGIALLFPTSDASVGWSTSTGGNHFGEVDDSTDTATFVSTSTVDQVDEYGMADCSEPPIPAGAAIVALCVSAYARRQTDTLVPDIALGFDDTVADVTGEDSTLSTTFERHDIISTFNPNTGAAFTQTEINASKARLKSRS